MIALLTRDLRLALRAGGGFGLALAFFLIVVVLVPFSIGPQPRLLGTVGPGVLWLGALLACLLSLDRLLALDFDEGTDRRCDGDGGRMARVADRAGWHGQQLLPRRSAGPAAKWHRARRRRLDHRRNRRPDRRGGVHRDAAGG